ncbi:polysaccharide deacetylase family protein [Marinobacter sp.]|uniref:polysaccharide deacetylase family protein n=1 Tax=Marinobacter sp. TaxID=50741 RepID=UPI0034A154A1
MARLKLFAKHCANLVLALYGYARIKTTNTPTLLILNYHRVLPTSHPDRENEQPGMVVSPERLKAHIQLVKQVGYVPMDLDSWVTAYTRNQDLPDKAVAFTFDDGWRDNYEFAWPVLKEEQVPATVFLVTNLVGTMKEFWPEQILRLLTSHLVPLEGDAFAWLRPFLPQHRLPESVSGLSLSDADNVVLELKAMTDQAIYAGLDQIYSTHPDLRPSPESRAILNSSELDEMSSGDLVSFGAHTRNHFRLNRLETDSDVEREIVGCLEDLKRITASAVPIFCYPNGDITDSGKQLVASHYHAACTTKIGWNRAGCSPFDLHRFNLHDGNSYNSRRLLATIGRGLL